MSEKPTYQALEIERDFLQAENEKLNFLIENSVDVIFELDKSLKFTYVSPSLYKNIGYTPAEWIGHRISEFTTWTEFAKMAREALTAIKNYKTFDQTTFETVFTHKNGNSIHFEIIGKVMFNSKGLPLGVIGGTRNISDRKEKERALKENEERNRNLVNHSPDIMYQYSTKRGGLFWSNRVTDILGYNPTEIINDSSLWYNSIHSEDKEKVQNAIEDNEKGEDYNIEYRIQSKQGKWVWLHDYFMHKTHLNDEVIIEGHATDITSKKETELALKESEKLLSAISRNYPNSFVSVINKDLTVGFTCGEEFYKLNLNPDDYVGLSLEQVFGKNTEIVKKHYLKAFAGEKISFELIIDKQHQLFKAVPLFDENNEVHQILAVAENITEKKLAEKKIQASEERLNSYINSTSDIVYTLDTAQRHTGVFGDWYKKSGMQVSDFIGKTSKEILGESSTVHEEANKQVLKGEYIVYEWKTSVNKKDIFYQTSLSPLKNKQNKIVGIIGVGRDITKQKEIEDKLNSTVSLLSATLESTVDGILVVDDSRKTFTYNKKFLELWKIPDSVLSTHNDKELIASVLPQLLNPDSFLKKVEEMYGSKEDSFDVLNFKDGRIYERYSKPQLLDGKSVGRVWSFRDVTAYNKAVDALRHSENKYRSLVDEVSEGFYISDKSATLTFSNRALAQILGFDHPDEVVGKKFTSFLPPEKVNELFGRYQQSIKLGTSSNALSTEIIRQDGTSRFIEITPSVIFKEGKPTGSSGLIQDITERKLAEDALKENQLRFEKSQALGHVGNWEYNIKSETFWVSDESKRIYGFDIDSNNFSIEQIENCIPERERIHQMLMGLIEHEKEYDIVFEIIPADNTPRKIIHSVAELERDNLNNPLRVRGVILDITKQKKVEQRLKTSQEKLTEAQAIAHLGHWEHDILHNKLTWSDEIFKIFEFGPQTFKPSYDFFLELIHPDDRERVDAAYTNSVQNKTKYATEHRLLLKSGTIKYVQEKCNTQYNENGEPIRSLGTVLDITELKKIEQLLKESNTSKDKFFSIIAHDLRSPFNSILGFTELLIGGTNNFEIADYKKFVGLINSTAKNTLVLLDNLLNWAKLQTERMNFNPEKQVFSSICHDVFKISQTSAANKSIILNCVESENITVFADRNMLKTILRNLISNAIKFTNQNGIVEVHASQNAEFIEIAVSDNGVGMDIETQNKLFKLESNESSPGTANEKGTGLGLILCKEFVEKHSGEIWVESELGKGSVFKFRLPKNKLNERE